MATQRLPVIYVRGFAGERGIESAVEDPFYGFNEGSVHVRVGQSGRPSFYQFESPLLRLMMDQGYHLFVAGSQERYLADAKRANRQVDPASVWVHRFYDVSAASFTRDAHQPADVDDDADTPSAYRPFDLVEAAKDLHRLILLVKECTGAQRVNLVAHSMGGLICRCLLQKVLPDAGEHGLDHVDRVLTYGTPHGGIEFSIGFGLLERLRDTFDIQGGDIFGPDRMYAYLTPEAERRERRPRDWDPRRLPPEAFPPERLFCIIGTNPGDYGAALGLSAKAVGPKSDGLVQIENAYVPGAEFAFIHRSHSGRFGMVNSEEGYQNLHRFLFGDIRVTADLVGVELPGTADDDTVWQAETRLSIRGLPIVMHEQLTAHHCPVQLEHPPDADSADRPVPLVTTYLSTAASRPSRDGPMRYVLQLRILSITERGGIFWFGNHVEQTADFDDTLVVDVQLPEDGGMPRAWARWMSQIATTLREYRPEGEPLGDEDPEVGAWQATVPLPATAGFLGDRAALRLRVGARHAAGAGG